jgi:hypothetical protein
LSLFKVFSIVFSIVDFNHGISTLPCFTALEQLPSLALAALSPTPDRSYPDCSGKLLCMGCLFASAYIEYSLVPPNCDDVTAATDACMDYSFSDVVV